MAWSDPVDVYCERLGPGLWGEPQNALSNMAFAAAAIALLRLQAQLRARGDQLPADVRALPGLVWGVALCSFAVFGRPASLAATAEQPRPGVVHVDMEPISISATEIRARISRGEDVSQEVPVPVLRYIQRNHLYGHP